MSSKPDLTILWLDDNRNPNIYFTNPNNTSSSAERNRGYYNTHVFPNCTLAIFYAKVYNKFQDYIIKHGLPDMVSFDHVVKVDPKFQEYNGTAIAKWLVEYYRETNQPLPWCYVHSANTKRIPIVEDILSIPHVPLFDKKDSKMKNSDFATKKSQNNNQINHTSLESASITKKSQEGNQTNHTLINNIKALMEERGYTQSSLARAMGKESVVINRALNGKVKISAKMQMDLADLFSVSVEELNGSVEVSSSATKNIRGFIRVSKN